MNRILQSWLTLLGLDSVCEQATETHQTHLQCSSASLGKESRGGGANYCKNVKVIWKIWVKLGPQSTEKTAKLELLNNKA